MKIGQNWFKLNNVQLNDLARHPNLVNIPALVLTAHIYMLETTWLATDPQPVTGVGGRAIIRLDHSTAAASP